MAFCFELLHAPFRADAIAAAIKRALVPGVRADGVVWLLSSIDSPRLATRLGEDGARVAALLLLMLPGAVLLYQGDEIGLKDGPGARPSFDRAGRDTHRHPMQWDSSASGGFSDAAAPWLPPVDPATRNVADQEREPSSMLSLYRAATSLRKTLGDGVRILDDVPDGVVAFLRGTDVIVVLNLTDQRVPCPVAGRVLLDTLAAGGYPAPAMLPPFSGCVVRSH
jgi:glycosidase